MLPRRLDGRLGWQQDDRTVTVREIHIAPPAKAYLQTGEALILIATFAGSITLSVYLVADCPNSRLQAILATASELFLTIPLMLLSINIVLHGKDEDSQVPNSRIYRPFIIAQLFVAFVLIVIAFLLLSFAVYVADTQKTLIGQWGIALMSCAVVWNVLACSIPLVRSLGGRIERLRRSREDQRRSREAQKRFREDIVAAAIFLGTCLTQLSVAMLLIGHGAAAASKAQVQFGCTAG